MYDPRALLASVDTNPVLFLALGAFAMVFNYSFFAEAIRAGRRDKAFALPLTVSTAWFAHDISFVFRGGEWFGTYQHWYVELFWVALIPTSAFELLFIWQVWKYGKDEIFPSGTRAQYAWLLVGSVVAGLIIWYAAKEMLGDPIYIFTFGGVASLGVAYGIRRTATRGNATGQSALLWGAFTCMLITWYTAVFLFFGPVFQTPAQFLLEAFSIGGGAFLTVWTARLNGKLT
ncbi:MAG: hypothetical protein WCG80_06070 [Spirochaetales bacterium]